jgi:quercetin dioxygenase-like cupin family protein
MTPALAKLQIDDDCVRVTEWRLPPGSAIGFHTHEMDYVVVPVTSGEMTLVSKQGEITTAQLTPGVAYARKAGVQHDVRNDSAAEFAFIEIEIKG